VPKFLILRFSSIGDIVLTTPVVRCLKQQVKDAEIHYFTKKNFSAVLDGNPYIDKKILLDDELAPLIQKMKEENYDAVIDLHHNLRTWTIKQKLGVKSYSFNKLNFEKWLIVNFKINRLPEKHIVDRYLETVKSFGVVNDNAGLDYFLSADDEKAVSTLPPDFKDGYVGFVIGAKHFTKRLPAEKIIAVCKQLHRPIVLLGGKEDFEEGESIVMSVLQASSVQRPASVFNACGKYSIGQSAALVKHASVIISHDTGLMHIAAAFKKDIVSIWGNTIPEFGMAPYFGKSATRSVMMEVKNLSCRPCSKIGFEKCPKGHFRCMNDIPVEGIVNATQN